MTYERLWIGVFPANSVWGAGWGGGGDSVGDWCTYFEKFGIVGCLFVQYVWSYILYTHRVNINIYVHDWANRFWLAGPRTLPGTSTSHFLRVRIRTSDLQVITLGLHPIPNLYKRYWNSQTLMAQWYVTRILCQRSTDRIPSCTEFMRFLLWEKKHPKIGTKFNLQRPQGLLSIFE
jgi:hypothetical protein